MLNNFKNHIENNFPFLKKARLLVAVSGGIDSVVLTHLLHKLNFKISIAHCNFNLRSDESDKDEVFVIELSKQLKIANFTTPFDTKKYAKENKLSIQEAARNLRYKWFYKIAAENQFDYIVTAHNLNDNLETFLINLTRGTGLKGLTGIPKTNQKTVRPLLGFSRKEINNFAIKNNIKWREDKSNTDTKYTRNKIRHDIIPVLESINPKLLDSFKNTLEHLKDSQDIVKNQIDTFKKNVSSSEVENDNITKFSIQKIKAFSNPKAYLYETFNNYGFTEWDDVLNLLTAQSGKQLFSKTHRLIKDRDYLLLSLRENKKERREEREERREIIIEKNDSKFNIQHSIFKIEHSTKICKNLRNQRETHFDKDLLKFPLKVRKWQKGDYFYPLGMTGKKKVSKFFKDEKYSLIEKENIWLLLSDNQVVWIIGKRQDNRFKVTKTTTQILEITQL